MTTANKWTAEDIPDQTGKVALVTGGNSGLGYETVVELARLVEREWCRIQGRSLSDQPLASSQGYRRGRHEHGQSRDESASCPWGFRLVVWHGAPVSDHRYRGSGPAHGTWPVTRGHRGPVVPFRASKGGLPAWT